MAKKWKIVLYETESGVCYVELFLDSLSDTNRAKAVSWIELLEDKGPDLPRPYADLLEDGIHELRLKLSGGQYRILYFFCHGDYVVLTHSLRKLTSEVNKAEIRKAKSARADVLKRYTLQKLQELTDEDF
jgi:phage-related protein